MSEPLKTMTVGSWATKNPIRITGHSYDDFKEFITYFYIGHCNINNDNVMALVDLAELYDIKLLKKKCDNFLSDFPLSIENVFSNYDSYKLYSLENAIECILDFIRNNASEVFKSPQFLGVKKELIFEIVQLENLTSTEEELFEAVSFCFISCVSIFTS